MQSELTKNFARPQKIAISNALCLSEQAAQTEQLRKMSIAAGELQAELLRQQDEIVELQKQLEHAKHADLQLDDKRDEEDAALEAEFKEVDSRTASERSSRSTTKTVSLILSLGLSGSEYQSEMMVPPKVSTSAMGSSDTISSEARQRIAFTGMLPSSFEVRSPRSLSLIPPGLPVTMETGPSSSCGGAGAKFEQLAISRLARMRAVIRMCVIPTKTEGQISGPPKIL